MLENTEMTLKYPHPLDTFHQFLTDCELTMILAPTKNAFD